MAVTGHPLTVQVAAAVLEAGGNAVDAGVAAGLATNVVQVDMCNLGGIAPILVRPAGSDQVMSIAGVGRWSTAATLDAYTTLHGTSMPPGCWPCIVPGALAGWLSALEQFGTWSFAEVVAPAVELAAEGFVLDATVAAGLDMFAWIYEQWPSSAEIYCPSGRRARPGDHLVQRDLGALLERLAAAETGTSGGRAESRRSREKGSRQRAASIDAVRRAFYEGEVADTIARFVTAGGGFLTPLDLSEFRAEVAPSPARRFPGFGDVTIHTTPAEWSQGPALLQALSVLERFDVGFDGHNSVSHLHLILEAVKLAYSDRELYYGEGVELEELLSEEHTDTLAALVKLDEALPDLPTSRHPSDDVASTTHIAVVDGEGTAFATAPSDTLAMGPVVPGLGIVVSGRGVQSRTDPSHPAAMGPLRRPRITPSPAIALDPEGMVWPITCPGGDVIVQAMIQAFLNVSVFGMTEQQAVEAPRAVSLAFPDSFYPHKHSISMAVVEDRVPEEVMKGLAALGHDVHAWPPYEFEAGSVGMIRQSSRSDGGLRPVLRAGADPRRAAYALGR